MMFLSLNHNHSIVSVWEHDTSAWVILESDSLLNVISCQGLLQPDCLQTLQPVSWCLDIRDNDTCQWYLGGWCQGLGRILQVLTQWSGAHLSLVTCSDQWLHDWSTWAWYNSCFTQWEVIRNSAFNRKVQNSYQLLPASGVCLNIIELLHIEKYFCKWNIFCSKSFGLIFHWTHCHDDMSSPEAEVMGLTSFGDIL